MYDFELVNACLKLLRDCFQVKPGETVCITNDTEGSDELNLATAQAAVILGAKPMVIKIAAPDGNGKAGDKDFPIDALVGALSATDVWVEYNYKWIFYSTVYDRVVEMNKKLRYMCLVGMKPDSVIRNIGKVDIPTLAKFTWKLVELTQAASHIKITSPAGTNLEFKNKEGREFGVADGIVNPGEVKMLPGQIGWAPDFETINGVLTFDGSINPPIGLVDAPVHVYIEKGKVIKVEGGASATTLRNWLASFDDPNMYNVAHASYGIGPNAILTGDVVEDERIWGAIEWGIGNVGAVLVNDIPGGIPASSHTDGVCLNCSVWLDGRQFLDNGVVVGPDQEIIDLARKLGK